jgi:mono/diheme cytochrome c family protein
MNKFTRRPKENYMKRKWISLVFILIFALALSACTGGKGSAPEADAPASQVEQADDQADQEEAAEAEDTEVDEAEAEETTAGESEPEAPPVEVAEIYAEFCARCHGDQRQGNPGPPLLPENLPQDASVYADIITNGKGSMMPSWGDTFNEDIINALAEWLKNPE